MNLFTCLSKSFFLLFNTLIFLIGICLIILGGIALGSKSVLRTIFFFAQESINNIVAKNDRAMWNALFDFIVNFAKIIGIVLVVLGGILFILSILGLIGVCKNNQCCLSTFIGLLSVLVIFQLIVIVIWIADKQIILTPVKAKLENSITEKYAGDSSSEPISAAWNIAQLIIECCGVNNGIDFAKSRRWNRKQKLLDVFIVPKLPTYNKTVTLVQPISCCHLDEKTFKVKHPMSCAQSGSAYWATNISHFQQGCFNKLLNSASSSLTVIDGVLIGVLALQLVVVLCAVLCLVAAQRDRLDGSIRNTHKYGNSSNRF